MNGFGTHRKVPAYVAALIVLVSLWLGIGFARMERLSWEDDEGTFLVTAQAVFAGHTLYRDVWFNYLPAFMELLMSRFAWGVLR